VLSLLLISSCVNAVAMPSDRVRHAKVTLQQCGSKEKSSHDLVITETAPTSVADRKAYTRFTVVSKEGGQSSVTIKKGANGWPTGLQMSGAGVDPDAITSMLFMMRQPLWPANPGATKWEAEIASPTETGHKVVVVCHLTHPVPGQKTVLLEQKTAPITIIAGMKAQFTSAAIYDSVGGTAKSVKVNIGVNALSKDGHLMFYEEQD
jgi:hypothetical protein